MILKTVPNPRIDKNKNVIIKKNDEKLNLENINTNINLMNIKNPNHKNNSISVKNVHNLKNMNEMNIFHFYNPLLTKILMY